MNQNKSIKYTYNPNPTLKYLPDGDSPKILQNSLLYLLYEGKYLHY